MALVLDVDVGMEGRGPMMAASVGWEVRRGQWSLEGVSGEVTFPIR